MALATKAFSFALTLCIFATAFASQVPSNLPNQPPPTVSVERYSKQLEDAVIQLKQIESNPPRHLAPVIQQLSKPCRVRRSDGQIQDVSNDVWLRLLPRSKSLATRDEVSLVHSTVNLQLRDLNRWSTSTYSPADAQAIVRQLESTGQIRTGPTWWQQKVSDFNKWLRNLWQGVVRWLEGLFPSTAPKKFPTIDPLWIKLFFYGTVFALLALLAYLVWRAVGGRLGKHGVQRGVFAEGEDAELLLLPPDDLRARAQAFAEAGNYREALRHLYIALLLTLDANGVWRYDARRTNWEHIRELRRVDHHAHLVAPLSHITRIFDRVRYGNAEFQREDWMRYERDVTEIHLPK